MRFTNVTGSHGPEFPSGCSINDGIPQNTYLGEYFKLQLPQIDRLVEFTLKKGRICLVSKKDLIVPSLLSVSKWSEELPFTRLPLSGQILFCHSSFQFTFVSTDLPMHNKGGCPYLPRAGVLSRSLSWWLLWRRISLSCCFGIFSTQPVISSTWFGFCSWQGFTTFDLYDLSHSRLPSRGSYCKSYGFTSRINDLSSCFVFHKETAAVSFWEALLPYCVC